MKKIGCKSLVLLKILIVGTHYSLLDKANLISTHNLCLEAKISYAKVWYKGHNLMQFWHCEVAPLCARDLKYQ